MGEIIGVADGFVGTPTPEAEPVSPLPMAAEATFVEETPVEVAQERIRLREERARREAERSDGRVLASIVKSRGDTEELADFEVQPFSRGISAKSKPAEQSASSSSHSNDRAKTNPEEQAGSSSSHSKDEYATSGDKPLVAQAAASEAATFEGVFGSTDRLMAIRLQAQWRRLQTRTRYHQSLREATYAIRLQAAVRRRIAKREFAARRLQSMWRKRKWLQLVKALPSWTPEQSPASISGAAAPAAPSSSVERPSPGATPESSCEGAITAPAVARASFTRPPQIPSASEHEGPSRPTSRGSNRVQSARESAASSGHPKHIVRTASGKMYDLHTKGGQRSFLQRTRMRRWTAFKNIMDDNPLGRKVMAFISRVRRIGASILDVSRNESTVIGFLAPPEEDEVLTPPQIVQIFWNMLFLELVLACVNNTTSPHVDDDSGSPRGYHKKGSGGTSSTASGHDTSWQKVDIVPALIVGLFNALFAYPYTWLLEWIFQWANRRKRRKPRPGLGQAVQAAAQVPVAIAKMQQVAREKKSLAVARMSEGSRRLRRSSQRATKLRRSSERTTKLRRSSAEGIGEVSPPPSPPATSLVTGQVRSGDTTTRRSQIVTGVARSWELLPKRLSLSTFGGRTPTQVLPVPEATCPGTAAFRSRVGPPVTQKTLKSQTQLMLSSQAVLKRQSKLKNVEAHKTRSAFKHVPKVLLPPKEVRDRVTDWQQRIAQPQVKTMYELYRARLEAERWMSDRLYYGRSAMAWLLVAFLSFLSALGSMAFAVQFGNNQTRDMLIGWAISVTWCFAIVEPAQIVIVTCIPFLVEEDSRCYLCFENIRWAYNEYFSP